MSNEKITDKAVEQEVPSVGDVLFFKAYIPKFVKECEARGVTFKTEEEVFDALQIADRLRMAKAAEAAGLIDAGQEKGGSMLKEAALNLDTTLFGSAPADNQDVALTLQDSDVSAALEAMRA